MATYYITTRDGDQLTCGGEEDMRRIVQRMANDRGEPIYIGPEGEDSEDEEITPVGEGTSLQRLESCTCPAREGGATNMKYYY